MENPAFCLAGDENHADAATQAALDAFCLAGDENRGGPAACRVWPAVAFQRTRLAESGNNEREMCLSPYGRSVYTDGIRTLY